jgi:hypothetical protein
MILIFHKLRYTEETTIFMAKTNLNRNLQNMGSQEAREFLFTVPKDFQFHY